VRGFLLYRGLLVQLQLARGGCPARGGAGGVSQEHRLRVTVSRCTGATASQGVLRLVLLSFVVMSFRTTSCAHILASNILSMFTSSRVHINRMRVAWSDRQVRRLDEYVDLELLERQVRHSRHVHMLPSPHTLEHVHLFSPRTPGTCPHFHILIHVHILVNVHILILSSSFNSPHVHVLIHVHLLTCSHDEAGDRSWLVGGGPVVVHDPDRPDDLVRVSNPILLHPFCSFQLSALFRCVPVDHQASCCLCVDYRAG
jgi:hypothetical protein